MKQKLFYLRVEEVFYFVLLVKKENQAKLMLK